jgi:hypothetical protein
VIAIAAADVGKPDTKQTNTINFIDLNRYIAYKSQSRHQIRYNLGIIFLQAHLLETHTRDFRGVMHVS